MGNLRILLLALAITQSWNAAAQVAVPYTPEPAPTALPTAVPEVLPAAEPALQPFGANLFRGRFTAEREDGLNPDYVIQQGDRISLRIWGAINIMDEPTVDPQGNIFIPEVGPVRVSGVRNGDLNGHIEGAVRRVYRENVGVYTNLQAVTPVILFVTGFVNSPGSYAGLASDSLLYFLDRAGGIDPERGSYREISILRNGKTVAGADLYDFLVTGEIPRIQFTDGDTILVARKGASIAVDGAARNTFRFEIPDEGMTGHDVIALARPQADAYYTTFTGTRNDLPFSSYLPLNELAERTIMDGDHITFEVDQVHDTILVRVEGAHIGQSRFAVPRDTRLLELLDRVKVDPAISDIGAISLRRESIKERQKKAIEETLLRLETAVLSKRSYTREGADVQMREAQLISNFVERARRVEPQGILVVAHGTGITDILLQPGDVIYIPDRTNIVQVSGEVAVPQALVHIPGARLGDYIDRVGGYTERADKKRHLILRRSGEVVPLLGGRRDMPILPGDEIVSLPAVPTATVEILQLITETMFRIASSAAIFLRL
jgi:protein involved in polysaccharide export with SLBB domain